MIKDRALAKRLRVGADVMLTLQQALKMTDEHFCALLDSMLSFKHNEMLSVSSPSIDSSSSRTNSNIDSLIDRLILVKDQHNISWKQMNELFLVLKPGVSVNQIKGQNVD